MARVIELSDDIRVEYNFPSQLYEVYNTTYSTTRETAETTLTLLTIIAPKKDTAGNPLDADNNPITIARLTALATTLETLTSLSYTLSTTGSYIKTIQLNSFSKYPLTIDLEKQKLYIMNTNIIHDLTLNDSVSHRVSTIKDYYKRHLGLDISTEDLTILYNILTSYITPHPYNTLPTITTSTSPSTIAYTNTVAFSDVNSLSPITYSLLTNPNTLYTTPIAYYIKQINSNRVLELTTSPTTLSIGDTILIDNTTTTVDDETSYSSNGTYTISAIDTAKNYIKVAESLAQFSTTYKTCYLKQPSLLISSIDRNTKTITCTTNIPNSILIGDTIYLDNTSQYIDYQTVSVDGEYTVYSISGNTIVVNETIATNYTAPTTPNAHLSKHIALGDITSIKDNVITVTGTVPTGITGLIIVIDDTEYTVLSSTTNTITVASIEDYTPNFGQVKTQVPVEQVEVNVLTSSNSNMPVGKFLLDTYAETISYIGTATAYTPTLTNFQSVGKVISQSMSAKWVDEEGVEHVCSVDTMKLKGVYSQIYSS